MRARRTAVGTLVALAALLTLLAGPGNRPAQAAARRPAICPASRWIESWYAAPSDADSIGDARLTPFVQGQMQTLREVITPTYGGSTVRIRLSNTFGAKPVTVSAAALAQDASGAGSTSAATVPGTSRPVLFNGQAAVTIPAGGQVVSDPTAFNFSAGQNLAVSLYVTGQGGLLTEHFSGRQISFASPPLAGNHTTDTGATAFTQTTTARLLLSGLDVLAGGNAGTVVTFGDSITDGFQGAATVVPETTSTLNLNARYPDFLAKRLQAAGRPLSVANAGITGNQLLSTGSLPMFGPPGVDRFTRDVLDVPGASTVIILLGTNDIGNGASAAAVEAGLTQLVAMARSHGLRVLLGTLTPMGQAQENGYATASATANREAVNAWIRSQHIADGYVDFDAAVRDPSDPNTMQPAYNGGDGLHFTPAGYQAMANAVNLSQLHGPACTTKRRVRPAPVHRRRKARHH